MRRDAYRTEYSKHWNSFRIDVLLCPVGPGPAPRHDTAKYWGYTAQWNLLDYPAAVFPTGLRATGNEPLVMGASRRMVKTTKSTTHDGQWPISPSRIGKEYGQNVVTCHGYNLPPIPTCNRMPFPCLFHAYSHSCLAHVLRGGK